MSPYTPDSERHPAAVPVTRDKTALAAELRVMASDHQAQAKCYALDGLRDRTAYAKAIVYRDASEMLLRRMDRVITATYDGEAQEVYDETLRELEAGLKQAAPHFTTTTTLPGRVERVSVGAHVGAAPTCEACGHECQPGNHMGPLGAWWCTHCGAPPLLAIAAPHPCAGAPGTPEQGTASTEPAKRALTPATAQQSACTTWGLIPNRHVIGEVTAHRVTDSDDRGTWFDTACGHRFKVGGGYQLHDHARGLDGIVRERVPVGVFVVECEDCRTGWVK